MIKFIKSIVLQSAVVTNVGEVVTVLSAQQCNVLCDILIFYLVCILHLTVKYLIWLILILDSKLSKYK